jgi:dCMP deaminase
LNKISSKNTDPKPAPLAESKKKHKRPSWDEYFLEITDLVSSRSTCLRRRVGSVLVKDKHVLATGYNGAPKGVTHCIEGGCLREQLGIPSGQRHEICRGLHAEQNAIIQAASHGVNISGSDLYSTTMPCVICAKMIINAGIRRVFFIEGYPDELAESFFREADVPLVRLNRVGKSEDK